DPALREYGRAPRGAQLEHPGRARRERPPQRRLDFSRGVQPGAPGLPRLTSLTRLGAPRGASVGLQRAARTEPAPQLAAQSELPSTWSRAVSIGRSPEFT